MFSASRASFTAPEAWLIWHSTLPSAPVAGLRARLDDELSRARALQAALASPHAPYPGFSGPLLMANGLWMRAISPTPLLLRLPSVYAVLLVLALSVALLRRSVGRRRVLALLLLGLPALLQALALPPVLPGPPLREAARLTALLRQPDEPLLNALPPWHPLVVHAQQTGLLAGLRLELAWQDSPHDEAALRRYAASTRLLPGRVWLLAEAESAAWRTLDEALRAEGRIYAYRNQASGALIVAYGR